jgi:hypothetical protein
MSGKKLFINYQQYVSDLIAKRQGQGADAQQLGDTYFEEVIARLRIGGGSSIPLQPIKEKFTYRNRAITCWSGRRIT